jgi:addiction module antidote protein, HigA family
MSKKQLPPVHPGEILREEFMVPLNLSANALARSLGLTAARVNDIVRERRGITADTALRLARFFNTTPDFWLNLQKNYELEVAERQAGPTIKKKVKPLSEIKNYGNAIA